MASNPDADRLMTVRDVLGELNGVSRDTFYRWRQLGVAPRCFRLPNGELRVRRGDLLDWLDRMREPAA